MKTIIYSDIVQVAKDGGLNSLEIVSTAADDGHHG